MSDLIELTAKQRIEIEQLLTRHLDSRLYQRALACYENWQLSH
ncbi:MAG TPA: hypothetical protein VNN73_14500 [Blastocatellia bacterium]|nr:hypothetical protein [Blastocatellia bacterium]